MNNDETIMIPISPAELMDRLAILEVRTEKMDDPAKLKNIEHELSLLREVLKDHVTMTDELQKFADELKKVSLRGWEAEDNKRDAERRKDFGEVFIEAARTAYLNNDDRARIKKEINALLGSMIIEEKSYEEY